MLALTIREKNGEERQLIFEKEEVTIGRAHGSDIVLPRSNISKRHARLVDKHDKVVIVDLRSTNGTYVNGRRITAPELLTYEDKVYIGDFVIRLSRPAEQHVSQKMTTPYTASATPEAGPRTSRGPTQAVDAPLGHEAAFAESDAMAQEPRAASRGAPLAPPPEAQEVEDERTRAVMAMPEEEEAPPAAAPVPRKMPVPSKKEAPAPPAAPPKKEAAPAAKASPKPKAEPAAAPVAQRAPPPDHEPATVATPIKRAAPPPPPPPPPVEPPEDTVGAAAGDPWAEWNAAIQAVVERIEREHELVPPEDAEAIASDAIAQATESGEIAQDTDRDALATDVVAELVGLGPLADTLADPTVLAVFMNGPKSVYIDRGAGTHEPNGRLFATVGSYRRTIQHLTGVDDIDEIAGLEDLVLADGATLRLVRAGAGAEPLVVWRRPAREVPLMADLVAEGLLDQLQAHALTHAVADGRNVLVCGHPSPGRSALVAALIGELGFDRRVVAVGDRTEVAVGQGDVARLSAKSLLAGGTTVLGLEPDLVVFERLDAGSVRDWAETCLAAGRPVIALSPEPFGERALKRIALMLELEAPSVRGAALVGEAVDVLVSLRTQADGMVRVDKIQEVEPSKDGFALKVPAKR